MHPCTIVLKLFTSILHDCYIDMHTCRGFSSTHIMTSQLRSPISVSHTDRNYTNECPRGIK